MGATVAIMVKRLIAIAVTKKMALFILGLIVEKSDNKLDDQAYKFVKGLILNDLQMAEEGLQSSAVHLAEAWKDRDKTPPQQKGLE